MVTDKLAAEPVYPNPDPLMLLFGHSNEDTFVVEEVEITELVDTGSKASAITEGFCTKFSLKIHPLELFYVLMGILIP